MMGGQIFTVHRVVGHAPYHLFDIKLYLDLFVFSSAVSSHCIIEMCYGAVDINVITKTSLITRNNDMTQKVMTVSIIPQLRTEFFSFPCWIKNKMEPQNMLETKRFYHLV
jgi:hypothetical protein